jgi:hypothetical protein
MTFSDISPQEFQIVNNSDNSFDDFENFQDEDIMTNYRVEHMEKFKDSLNQDLNNYFEQFKKKLPFQKGSKIYTKPKKLTINTTKLKKNNINSYINERLNQFGENTVSCLDKHFKQINSNKKQIEMVFEQITTLDKGIDYIFDDYANKIHYNSSNLKYINNNLKEFKKNFERCNHNIDKQFKEIIELSKELIIQEINKYDEQVCRNQVAMNDTTFKKIDEIYKYVKNRIEKLKEDLSFMITENMCQEISRYDKHNGTFIRDEIDKNNRYIEIYVKDKLEEYNELNAKFIKHELNINNKDIETFVNVKLEHYDKYNADFIKQKIKEQIDNNDYNIEANVKKIIEDYDQISAEFIKTEIAKYDKSVTEYINEMYKYIKNDKKTLIKYIDNKSIRPLINKDIINNEWFKTFLHTVFAMFIVLTVQTLFYTYK